MTEHLAAADDPPPLPTPPWPELVEPSPAQLAAWIRELPEEDAERVCARILWVGGLQARCFLENHQAELARLRTGLYPQD